MSVFRKNRPSPHAPRSSYPEAFAYVPHDACYLDAACQTLRPQSVIDAETDYYLRYNACGGRVKYKWGMMVDEKVQKTRTRLLQYAHKDANNYCVAFTQNTTYGINLVLHQLAADQYDGIITTDIEHNSVMLPALTWAKKHGKTCTILSRDQEGNILYDAAQLQRNIIVVNSMSNIDGRRAQNLQKLTTDAHAAGGTVLVDAAQGFAHDIELIRDVDADAIFGSGHKMYGPSVGFIMITRALLDKLQPFFIGGGTVSDVEGDTFALLRTGSEAHAVLEPGLQNWGGIIGLGHAVQWLTSTDVSHERNLAQSLFEQVGSLPRVHMINQAPSSIVSFHVDGIDAHQMALFLSEKNIMCRSGYFCCHRYLQHQLHSPPLLRVSLGLYNTQEHINRFTDACARILSAL